MDLMNPTSQMRSNQSFTNMVNGMLKHVGTGFTQVVVHRPPTVISSEARLRLLATDSQVWHGWTVMHDADADIDATCLSLASPSISTAVERESSYRRREYKRCRSTRTTITKRLTAV